MKTIDLAEGDRSITEILELAKSEPVLVHSADGRDFLVEEADAFEREAAVLGASEQFMAFLDTRSKEKTERSAADVARRLGIDSADT